MLVGLVNKKVSSIVGRFLQSTNRAMAYYLIIPVLGIYEYSFFAVLMHLRLKAKHFVASI